MVDRGSGGEASPPVSGSGEPIATEQAIPAGGARDRLLASVVERTNDFVGIATPDGRVVYVNDAGRKMVGLDPAFDVTTTSMMDYVAPEDHALMRQTAVPAVERVGRWMGLVRYRHWGGGPPVPALWNSFRIVDADGPEPELWVTISPDLREVQSLQRTIQESEERLALALQAGGFAAWEWSPSASVWTPAVFELLGIDPVDEPSSELFFESVHPEDLPGLQQVWSDATVGSGTYDHEFRVVHPDGEIRWVRGVGTVHRNEDGEVVRMYGLNWDVTEDRRLRRERERSAAVARFISDASRALSSSLEFDDIHRAIVELCVPFLADAALLEVAEGDPPGPFRAVARHATEERLAGALGAWVADRADGTGDAQTDRETIGEAVPGETTLEGEMPGGGRLLTHLAGLHAADPDGQRPLLRSLIVMPLVVRGSTAARLYLATGHGGRRLTTDDATVVAQLAQRAAVAMYKARLFERAQQASVAKGEFLTTMSHEIRTPLTAVLGYTELLAAGEDDPKRRGYLAAIERNGAFLLDILNDVLDLAKIEAGKLPVAEDNVSPRTMVGDIHSMMRQRADDKGLEFRILVADSVPDRVRTDGKRLRQILINLVGNAIKFTESGSVDLTVGWGTAEGRIDFEIADTGIGIAEDELSTIFSPFSQIDASTARERAGTGLGLAISERLARMLGGEITVRSQEGAGSVFLCSLPAANVTDLPDPAASEIREFLQDPDARISRDAKVLVVEDQPDLRSLVELVLRRAGAAIVDCVEDGEQALEKIAEGRRRSGEYDLVLLDMHLPRLDGYRTVEMLREEGYAVPVLAVSADATSQNRQRCLDLGCDAFLPKPIDQKRLIRTAIELLERSD